MTTEDRLTSRMVEYYEQMEYEYDLSIEHHYNHYGDRGVVDLVSQEKSTNDIHLYEFKSNTAIDSVTGANEIIRQFNKMRRYFFRDESTPAPRDTVTFELCFLPTYEAYRHVHQNAELYKSAVQRDIDIGLSEIANTRVNSQVTMRPYDEDRITPVLLFTQCVDYRENIEENGNAGSSLLGDWVTTQYLNIQQS